MKGELFPPNSNQTNTAMRIILAENYDREKAIDMIPVELGT